MKFLRLPSLACALLCVSPTAAQAAPGRYSSVARALSAQLDRHPVILLGEHHGSAGYHEMLQALLHHTRFVCRLNDVVLESGNRLYQSTADRYVSGAQVPRSEKVQMWRNTTQWLVWDSPDYERIYDTIRDINVSRRCRHPIRVVLGDPAIPWAEVHDAVDYRKYGERDRSYADVIAREVLARHHRALMVAGGLHVEKSGALETAGARPMAASILEREYPGKILSIQTVIDPAVAEVLGLPRYGLVLVRNRPLGKRSYVALAPNASAKVVVNGKTVWKPLKELTFPPIETVVDGLIYVGDDPIAGADPAIYREPEYQAELRRRAPILKEVYGFDFLPDLEELLKTPAKTSSN